jgi:hypothetical protein
MHRSLVTACLLLSIAITGCAVSSQATSKESYRASSFTEQSLNQDGLAILPVLAGQGVEGYRRPFGQAVNETADSLLTQVTPWQQTMDQFNDAGIVSEYNDAIQAYQSTSILDRELLEKMRGATDSRYYMYMRLAPPQSESDVSYNSFSGVTTTETNSVSAYGQIWDAEVGDVVWEGVASAAVTTGEYTYTDESTSQRAAKTAHALMRRVLNAAPQQGR